MRSTWWFVQKLRVGLSVKVEAIKNFKTDLTTLNIKTHVLRRYHYKQTLGKTKDEGMGGCGETTMYDQ